MQPIPRLWETQPISEILGLRSAACAGDRFFDSVAVPKTLMYAQDSEVHGAAGPARKHIQDLIVQQTGYLYVQHHLMPTIVPLSPLKSA